MESTKLRTRSGGRGEDKGTRREKSGDRNNRHYGRSDREEGEISAEGANNFLIEATRIEQKEGQDSVRLEVA